MKVQNIDNQQILRLEFSARKEKKKKSKCMQMNVIKVSGDIAKVLGDKTSSGVPHKNAFFPLKKSLLLTAEHHPILLPLSLPFLRDNFHLFFLPSNSKQEKCLQSKVLRPPFFPLLL